MEAAERETEEDHTHLCCYWHLELHLLGVMVLHKLRERRIYSILVKEKDRDLLALRLLLQKERDRNKEMKRKNEEMKAKIYSLRSQKMELDRRVMEMKSTMDSLKEEQRVMESAFEEKQNEIKMLQEKVSDLGKDNPEFIALKEKFQQKETEMEDLKHRFEDAFKSHGVISSNNSTILPGKVSDNGTMQSHDEATKYEDGKGITIEEDASKNKLTNFEILKRKRNNDKSKKQEVLQVDGGDAGDTANDKIADGEENALISQNQGEEFENDKTDGGQEFSLKQLEENPKIPHDEKRKPVRISRTKGKRWRTMVKEVNKRSRKLNRDQRNDKNNEREEEEMSNDNPRKSKAEAEEQLQKPGSHDDIQDDRNKIVNDISQHVIDKDIGEQKREQPMDEKSQSEKQEGSQVEQSWSRRHVNLEEMNAGHENTGTLHKELEEPEVGDAQEEKDGDFSMESLPDLADEIEYKGEMHESEFQAGL